MFFTSLGQVPISIAIDSPLLGFPKVERGKRLKCTVPPLKHWSSSDIYSLISFTRTSSHCKHGLGYRVHRVASWGCDVIFCFSATPLFLSWEQFDRMECLNMMFCLFNNCLGTNMDHFSVNCGLLRGITNWRSVGGVYQMSLWANSCIQP